MCKNSHIIDSSYEWYLGINDLVDDLVRAKDHVRASASLAGWTEASPREYCKRKFDNSPPGLSSFPHLWLLGHEEKSNQL